MPKRASMNRRAAGTPAVEAAAAAASSRIPIARGHARFPTLCLMLFAGSGCAALIYEIVWFQLLQLAIGSSAISLGFLLAAYMGGLCGGSLALARLVPARVHPLRAYAVLELCIAVFGLAALKGVPAAGRIYAAGSPGGLAGLAIRGCMAAAWLLPPAALMGASLPALSRWFDAGPGGVSWMGLLYSANIAGAVVGCLGAGFYLLRVHDLAAATYAAAAVNAAAGLIGWALARAKPYEAGAAEGAGDGGKPTVTAAAIYAAIALSGFTALGAEVVWTRLLSLMLGATVYAFSIVLAVFLIGLWAGSWAGSRLSRRVSDPRRALGMSQLLLAAAIAWTAFTIARVLPYWPVDPALSNSPWFNFDLDLTRTMRTILPATLLWGASFPLGLAAAAKGQDPARLTGRVYAANTAGSIAGALLFSLWLIPWVGTKGSQQILISMAAVAAGAAFAAAALHSRRRLSLAGAAGSLVAAWGLASTVSEVPWQAIAYGRRSAPILHAIEATPGEARAEPLFVGEGINASVVIAERGEQRFFYVSGKSEASSAPIDMRLQRLMGHIPALLHPSPRSVLVVGFGAGVTAGSFPPYPEVRRIAICELEALIPPASDQYFGQENGHVLRDPRTQTIYDDARHFIFTTKEKFDIITTDPIHPWVKGTAALYSRQYYELVRSHLNPGGIAAQWLPLYESDEETVKTELATFFSVFPNATLWSNHWDGDGYDLALVGRLEDSPIDVDGLQRRLDQPSYWRVARSLAETGFHSAEELMASYAGRAGELQPMTAGAVLNEDSNLRLQYLAGMGVNAAEAPRLYREILGYRKFPEDLFTGEGAKRLRAAFERPQRSF
ncbi:MAG TPA: fused MFS/spermidine synthase [Bryobacteraceae bacterium]|nr:fused MFS/spermidine synthase [Bryobacteraceae bacterium]